LVDDISRALSIGANAIAIVLLLLTDVPTTTRVDRDNGPFVRGPCALTLPIVSIAFDLFGIVHREKTRILSGYSPEIEPECLRYASVEAIDRCRSIDGHQPVSSNQCANEFIYGRRK
jgi:hypothetical protein